MKVLIDTCVLIDYITHRGSNYQDVVSFIRAASVKKFDGFLSSASATDIYFYLHKSSYGPRLIEADAKKELTSLLSFITLVDCKTFDVILALNSSTHDFEDGVVIEIAKRERMDIIVTQNIEHFKYSSIHTYSPVDFLKIL